MSSMIPYEGVKKMMDRAGVSLDDLEGYYKFIYGVKEEELYDCERTEKLIDRILEWKNGK